MFRFAAGAVIALLFSGSAFAQSAVYDWTGVYVGANGGYGWGLEDSVDFTYTPACLPAAGCPASVGIDPKGFLAGGHIGANWQHNMWVLGIEGDADWTDINDSGVTTIVSPATTATASQDLEWLATLRGRAGITANRALVYATGGLAFGEVNDKATLNNTATFGATLGTWAGAETNTEVGWTVGGGFEYAATPNLILGVEALYVDLGNNSVTLTRTPPVASPVITADFDNQYVIARGRVSWKW
jgi:outer membrane immunogenic protein